MKPDLPTRELGMKNTFVYMRRFLMFSIVYILFLLLLPVVHADGPSCFPAGTKITLSDGTLLNIEDVSVGDFVVSFDEDLKKVYSEVKELESPVRDHYYTLAMGNGILLNVTDEHPLFIRSGRYEGWGALNPASAFIDSGFDVRAIAVGDFLLDSRKRWVQIESIQQILGDIQTYNLKRVCNVNTFFAEGFLVHNKGGSGNTGGGGGSIGGGGGGDPCGGGSSGGSGGGGGGCECSGSQTQSGAACGNCGTLQRTCDGCNWGAWNCTGEGVCSPGSTQCAATTAYVNTSSCGSFSVGNSCGGNVLARTTVLAPAGCSSFCEGVSGASCCATRVNPRGKRFCIATDGGTVTGANGPWNYSSASCSTSTSGGAGGSTFQTCSSSCTWQNNGTDADGDGTDAECGDAACDLVMEVTDATQLASEISSCTPGQGHRCATCNDNIDNDCSGGVDHSDSSASPQECCSTTRRGCRDYTIQQLTRFRDNPILRKRHHFTQGQMETAVAGAQTILACGNSTVDSVCCADAHSCVWGGTCYPNLHRADFDGDGLNEVCVAGSPGEWIDEFEMDCDNGFDDDYDGFTDCQDWDCAGELQGTVTNDDSQTVEGARVEVFDETLNLLQTDTTNALGGYFFDVQCGNYSVVINEENYLVETISTEVPFTTTVTEDATLFAANVCESDCTLAVDNTIRATCNNVNGCVFYDAQAAQVCDNAQPGWTRQYNSTHEIECASGTPQNVTSTEASITCEDDNIIKTTKVVNYNGKLVKLVVVTCG